MIKQISWDEYFTYLAIGLIIYYAVVLFLYYRGDLVQSLSGRRKLVIAKSQRDEPGLIITSSNLAAEGNEAMFGLANQLISELREVFQNDFIKEELIMALQVKLREYSSLEETPFKISVNNYIESESEKSSIRLSEEDLRGLW